MSKSEETTDKIIEEAYSVIKSEHPCWPVIIYGIIITFVTITGILSNVSVIFVTIRTKSFRGSVHILLAFYSLCEICNLSGNFLSIFTAFSGHYFMQLKSIVYFVIPSIEFIGCAINLMLFIGIERLFVVLFPLKNFNHKIFLAITLLCNLIFFILISVINSKCVDESDSLEIFGNLYAIGMMIAECSLLGPFVGLIIMTSTVFVYGLIAVALHYRKVSSNDNFAQFNMRIFRSLFTILFMNFGGYLILFLALFIIKPIANNNPMALWHTNQISGILMHISAASNGPILYWTSSEYREAFQKTFAVLFKAFCKSSAVVPQPLFTRNVPMKNSAQTKF